MSEELKLFLIRPVSFDNPTACRSTDSRNPRLRSEVDELVEVSSLIGINMGERVHHIKPRAGDNLFINLLVTKSLSTSKPLAELKTEFEKLGRVAYLHEKEKKFCRVCDEVEKRTDHKYCGICGEKKEPMVHKLTPLMLGVFASEEEVKKVLG